MPPIHHLLVFLVLGLLPPATQEVRNGLEELAALEQRLELLSAKIIPSTVGLQIGGSWGSGVIVTEDGYILTVAHLFRAAEQPVRVHLHDGREVDGKTLGRMARDDFALVKIVAPGTWPHREMGRSSGLKPGDLCIGTGHPGGVQSERTPPLRFGRILDTQDRFLRTTCIVDRGDSGGPLFDLEGRVIAVHSRIGMATSQNFHVPVDRYRDDWDRLAAGRVWGETDFPDGPIIGIRGDGGPRGTRIERVYPDLPAEEAGLRAGDVILKVGDQAVSGIDHLKEILASKEIGQEVELELDRAGEILLVRLQLARSPNQPQGEESSTEMPVVAEEQEPVLGRLESAKELVTILEPLVAEARSGLVRIKGRRNDEILGTVVGAEGWIVSKASCLGEQPRCILPDGREVASIRVQELAEGDLVLLKAEVQDLRPIALAPERAWGLGRFLISLGREGPQAGVVGVAPRAIPSLERGGYLGVQLSNTPGGVRVEEVMEGTAADRARLKVGDLIISLDDEPVSSFQALIALISRRVPGTQIKLQVRRGEESLEIAAALGARPPPSPRRGRRFRRPDTSEQYSQRRDGFALAVQHDAPLGADDCGSPVFDLQGRCVGINIARASRTATLAIPSNTVAAWLQTVLPAAGDAAGAAEAGKPPPPKER